VLLPGLFLEKADAGLYSGAFKLYSPGLSVVTRYFAVLLPRMAEKTFEPVE
jgi:O-antigen/teichoic acid export membrane protein